MRLMALLSVAAGLTTGVLLQLASRAATPTNPTVPGYHNHAARGGHYVVPGLTWAAAATAYRLPSFDGHVSGNVYAQPLYWLPPGAAHGVLIVATEANVVQAIDAETGTAVWTQTLGPVVSRSDLPCGNISPVGITGTPVIDQAKAAIYLDAFITDPTAGAQHLVFGLSLTDGSILPGWPVNIASQLLSLGLNFTPTIQNQRGALSLVNGNLYVPFGGNAGDCQAYNGWVVGLNETTPKVFGAWVTRAQKGGIWSQGALAYDGTSLFTATGNTAGTVTWGDGEAIIRLPSSLQHSADTHDYFAPSNWQTLDSQDTDLGGTGPLPLNLPLGGGAFQPLLLALGKDGNAYLLDRSNLGGIGGALLVQQVANSEIITGPATYPVPGGVMVALKATGSACPSPIASPNLVALAIRPGAVSGGAPTLATAWCASFAGGGAPIVTTDGGTNPVVWVVGGEGDQRLHGFRGDTGQVLFAGGGPNDLAPGVRHLSTLIAADGKLYVAGDGQVFAFAFNPALP